MNRIVLLSLVVLSPVGTIGTVGLLAQVGTGSSIGLISVVGSKVSRAESRTTNEFDWIDLSGLETVCFYGPASSQEDASEDLLDLVETIVEDRTLKIRLTDNISMGDVASAQSTGDGQPNFRHSTEADFVWPVNKNTRPGKKSRFEMPGDEIQFADFCTSLDDSSARQRSYPRQPRVSKVVAETVKIDGGVTVDVNEYGNESFDDSAGETGTDEEDDH